MNASRRYLLSPPTHLEPGFLFNPWRDWDGSYDRARAVRQWEGLAELVEQHLGAVEVVPPSPHCPALTFTRDVALVVDDRHAIVLANDGDRGIDEPPIVRRWFADNGYSTESVPLQWPLDGGNLAWTTGGLLVGLKDGAIRPGDRYLGRLVRLLLDVPTIGVPLTDRRFLHLDMALCDLAGAAWLAAPSVLAGFRADPAWDDILGERLVVELDDSAASTLAANLVIAGDVAIGPEVPDVVGEAVEAAGLVLHTTPLDELHQAGGSAHCLTLELHPPDLLPSGTST